MNTRTKQENIRLIMDLLDNVRLDIEDILISLEGLSKNESDEILCDVIQNIKSGSQKILDSYWLLSDIRTKKQIEIEKMK